MTTPREPVTTFRDTAVPTCPTCHGPRVREWTAASVVEGAPLTAKAECDQGHTWAVERVVMGKEQKR